MTSNNLLVHYIFFNVGIKIHKICYIEKKTTKTIVSVTIWVYNVYLCSEVICEVRWFQNMSGGCFKRKQMEVGARKIIMRQFEFKIEQYQSPVGWINVRTSANASVGTC